MDKYINKKVGELPIQKLSQEISSKDLLWDFDAVSLYPCAMSDEKLIYPRIETRYAYTKNMNDELVEKIKSGNFTQGSAILKMKYFTHKNLIV